MQNKQHGEKYPKSNTERQRIFRANKTAAGEKEVRGIFANDENAVKIKEFAAMLKGT